MSNYRTTLLDWWNDVFPELVDGLRLCHVTICGPSKCILQLDHVMTPPTTQPYEDVVCVMDDDRELRKSDEKRVLKTRHATRYTHKLREIARYYSSTPCDVYNCTTNYVGLGNGLQRVRRWSATATVWCMWWSARMLWSTQIIFPKFRYYCCSPSTQEIPVLGQLNVRNYGQAPLWL